MDGSESRLIVLYQNMRKILNSICCHLVRMWLIPRAEGAPVPVPAIILRSINNHLDQCGKCSIDLKNLRLTAFVLRAAGSKNRQRCSDPLFAERVIARVRRGEAARKKRLFHLRIAAAAASALVTVTILIICLGGYDPLNAQWFLESHSRTTVAPAALTPPPYPNRDPFALTTGTDTNLSLQAQFSKSADLSNKITDVHSSIKRIPDLLSSFITKRQSPSLELAIPAAKVAPAVVPTPVLVSSTFSQQDKLTAVPILAASNPSPASLKSIGGLVLPSSTIPSSQPNYPQNSPVVNQFSGQLQKQGIVNPSSDCAAGSLDAQPIVSGQTSDNSGQ